MKTKKEHNSNWIVDVWDGYGGFKCLIFSKYFVFTIAFTILCGHLWTREKWWDTVISTLPSILGFSLAGLAMMLSFGSERFQKILMLNARKDKKGSAFSQMCSSYCIFILLQTLGILMAILSKASYFPTPSYMPDFFKENVEYFNYFFWGLSWLVFSYSLMQLIAALSWIFRVCQVYEKVQSLPDQKPNPRSLKN